jgi:plastocyanin
MIGFRSFRRTSAGSPLLPALALLAALLVGACNPGANAADALANPVETTTVDLPPSYKFVPVAIAVAPGSTVTWTNNDNFTHNVRFEGDEPQQMSPGQSVTRTFDTAGTFPYVCSLHPNDMSGAVVVRAD